MIHFDLQNVKDRIKPVNGVGQPPFRWLDFSLLHYLKDAGIPFSRLHDAGGMFGGNCFVDIPNIFRDFDKDETAESSYDFAFTDELIKSLEENGIEPFYRLGVTIENYHKIKAYRIFPPKDNMKWARICEMIIRHYTQGWANGFFFNIKYWEIWNEPDNEPEAEDNPMWKGTKEEFLELYRVTATHLKQQFPNIKVGGYASCGFYASAYNVSDARYLYFEKFADDFFAFCRENSVPLDFFSWHSYADIEHTMLFARTARKKLDENGFFNTESICNEWNPDYTAIGTLRHASLIAGMMLAFTHESIDSAMFYDAGLTSKYGSLINPIDDKPLPEYFSFVMMNELISNGNAVECSSKPESGVFSAATLSQDGLLMIMAANTSSEAKELFDKKPEILSASIISSDGIESYDIKDNIIPPESVLTIICQM